MKNKIIALFILVTAFTCSIAYAKSTQIINENFDNGYRNWDSSLRVGGTFSLVPHNSGKALKIERSYIGGDNFTQLKYRIPPNVVAGKHLIIEAKVKAENIEIGQESFYGGHIDFEIRTARGDSRFPSAPFFMGSFDWTPMTFECTIPTNAKIIVFRLGLQGAKGIVYFDDVKVFVQE